MAKTKIASSDAAPLEAPPNLNACLNISDYMYYGQYLSYSSTSLQSQINFKPLRVDGNILETTNADEGLFAEAFVSTGAGPKTIVIGYEGTDLYDQKNPNYYAFTGGQVVADANIAAGQTAPSFPTSVQFANSVLSAASTLYKSYTALVTGHSLGAAEAEYVAASTGLSGYTFGTPGIVAPSNAQASQLTNFVDYGDPVGNYANDGQMAYGPQTYGVIDPTTYPRIIISNSIKHYQSLSLVGQPSNYDDLSDAIEDYDEGYSFAAVRFDDALPYHYLTNYASDLQATYDGIQLYSIDGLADGSVGSDSNFSGLVDPTANAEAACYVFGTLIRTAEGDRPIECLRVGDLAVTAGGELRAITWLGHRTIDCRRYSRPADVYPVRISAQAFGAGLPERDLYLSPGHLVLVGADEDGAGGHLVPIMCLINGTTVRRVPVDSVSYWHVELGEHDILLAEGLPAESYIDLGSRPWFAGADGALFDPDLTLPGMPGRSRPVAIDGPVVEAERRRLDALLATMLAGACAWPNAEDLHFAVV